MKSRVAPPFSFAPIPHNLRYFVSELFRAKEGDKDYTASLEILRKAKYNSSLYLTSDFIDVYVATSMRSRRQFQDVAQKISSVFHDSSLQELKVRYFDPTASEGSGRLSKGLIEALMLKRAKVTLYLAQESDSLGKDSELAATLAQGKDVIILVPTIDESRLKELIALKSAGVASDLQDIKDFLAPKSSKNAFALRVVNARSWDEISDDDIKELYQYEIAFYNDRADILRSKHPLGLQVNLQTGVAHGVIVVRTEKDAAKMIFRSLTNSHEYRIDGDNDPEWKLVEVSSNSTVRFVTKDIFLTKAFWSNYLDLKRHE